MRLPHILFASFLLIPLLEIYLLIQVGSVFGAFTTVILVVFTAVLGAALVRAQGIATLMRAQTALQRGELPAGTVLEGAMLLVAGALLLTPGFFTDAIGFSLLVPAVRRWLVARVGARLMHPPGGAPKTHDSRVIEGEFRRDD